jgi:hypothetical protein
MEDVLDLSAQPHDARFPVVCFDESPYQLIGEVRQPQAPQSGHPQRYDYQDQRNGTGNLFMFFAPRSGWRQVEVTTRRTKRDFVRCMQQLVDGYYPEAEVIRVVVDNLNIPTPAALYDCLPPREAHRVLQCLEFHYTPKHGSWLNMVEIELSVALSTYLSRCNARARKKGAHLCTSSGGQRWSRDLSPALESFLHLLPIRGCGKPMPTWAEMLGDGSIGREEALDLA